MASKNKTDNRSKRFREEYGGYIYIMPWIIGFFVLTLIPLISLIGLSFTDYDLMSAPKLVKLDNYIEIFTKDKKFLTSLKVTFLYAFTSVPLKLIVALLVAVLLNQKQRGINLYRTLFYIPSIIGGSIAVAIMWRNLFAREGAVNEIIQHIFGVNPDISWVGDPKTALGSLVLMAIWQFGSPMLIFLAGLKNISKSYYEAATVDGANAFHRFKNITVPLLTPIIFFNLIMQLINGFMAFTQGLVVTNGGPLDKTLFFQLYVYQKGFTTFDMGYASALSCILLVIIICLTSLVFKSSDGWVYYENKGK